MNKQQVADMMRRREAPVEEYMDACVMDYVLGFEEMPEHVLRTAEDKPGVLFQAVNIAKTALYGVDSVEVNNNLKVLSGDVERYKNQEQAKNRYGAPANSAEMPAEYVRSKRTGRQAVILHS